MIMADRGLSPPEPPEHLLLVEGQDDKHVVLHLRDRSESMPEFCISDKDGLDPLLEIHQPRDQGFRPQIAGHPRGCERRTGESVEIGREPA